MRKHKSVILKLLSAACALLLAIQVMSPAAYALNGVAEGSDATSGPLYDVYQILQCDVRPAEEADLPYLGEGVQIGDKLASNFRFGKNIDIVAFCGAVGADLTNPDFLAVCAAMGVVPEVGGTISDTLVYKALYGEYEDIYNYNDQEYTIALQKMLDADSEPYASGLTLSELNAYAAEPGYYLITNTPGSVTGNNGYTRGITTVTDSETGFDVIPKSFSLEIDKSVARIPFGGIGINQSMVDGIEPLLGREYYDTNREDIIVDPISSIAPGLSVVTSLVLGGYYSPSFDKKIVLNAGDAALYKLTVQIPLEAYASFSDTFYMQFQDMLPDGFIGFPAFVNVQDAFGESMFQANFWDLLPSSDVGGKWLPPGATAWLSNPIGSVDTDLLRSEFKINVLLDINRLGIGPRDGALRSPVVDVLIYAVPVLDGHDTDQMPIALDANVNNSRLFYQNNPNEQVFDVSTDWRTDDIAWRDATVPDVSEGVYAHRCSDVGIGEAPTAPSYKQLSLASTADSDRTQADAYLSGLTFYYGSHTGQPISNAKFSLRRLPWNIPSDSGTPGAIVEYLEANSNMTFAALRQPVFSASEIGLYRKLTSGAYTPLTNLPADRYADELLYQAHAAHMPSLGYIGPMLPQDGGTDLDETRMQELLEKNAVIITTDENGMVSFVGLPMGDYCLEQLAPVQGYSMAGPVYFRIEADESGEGRQISFVRPDRTGASPADFGSGVSLFTELLGQDNAPELVMSPDGWFYLNLIASSGVVLPTTGGAGTAAILVAGAFLIACGGVVYFTIQKRRRAA